MTLHMLNGMQNATIIACLLRSMKPKISDNYFFLEIIQQIWDVVNQAFTLVRNTTHLY